MTRRHPPPAIGPHMVVPPDQPRTQGLMPFEAYVNAMFEEHRKAIDAALVQVATALDKAERVTTQRHEAAMFGINSALADLRIQIHALQSLKANEPTQVERVDSLRRETEALRLASEKAIIKSESATERRFDAVNEFRAQLTDQAATFVRRDILDARVQGLEDRIANNTTRVDTLVGAQAGSAKTIGVMLAVAVLVVSIISVAVRFIGG